jgi:glutathione S-transferase
MQLTLYYAPRACSLVPLVTLHEADARFDIVNVNLSRQQHQDPAYLKINPKHKVPVLAMDGDPLTENVAIQIWIARTFPQARLMPADPLLEIKAISLLAWCASGIHPALTPNAQPGQFCDVAGTEDSVRRIAQKKLRENYRIADDLLAGRDWFFEHFTAVDAYFFWCFRRGILFNIDLSEFGNCTAHFERMLLRDSVQKALAYEARTMELFSRQV